MKIPSPAECGLPEKFDKWRSCQPAAIDLAMTNHKRVTGICSPTGTGKSLIAVAIAKLSKDPTCIVTSSRGLQSQYTNDFKEVGMVDIRGRANYTCHLREDYTCEDGFAGRCPYKGTVACEATAAEMRAATSNLVVTNYSKWIHAKRFGRGMEHFTRVIFDEAHEAPEALASAMRVILHYKEIENVLGVSFPAPNEAETFQNWKYWAGATKLIAQIKFNEAKVRIESVRDPKTSWVKHFNHMRNLVRRLSIIAAARGSEWVSEEVNGIGYQFDPIEPARYAESQLLLKVPRIIAISATIREKTLFMMGIGRANFEFREYDSDFDPKRAPVYYIPTGRFDAKHPEEEYKMYLLLDQLAARRRDRKAIVHTISYGRQTKALEFSDFKDNMIVNLKGDPPTETIEFFKASENGTILVSPSVGTGYDFPDDDCRWQLMCKVPFEPPSKVVKAREQRDKDYRGYKAIQYMQQAFGRDVRSRRDWSEGFIGDTHMDWFWGRYKNYASRAFQARFKEVKYAPAPPKKEAMA